MRGHVIRGMELAELFQRLGIALGLGLLVGLQRERAGSRLAGFRTFPLVALLGGLCALLGEAFDGWIVGAGFGALAAVIVVGNLPMLKTGEEPPGITTEVAMLVMFLVGACVVAGYAAAAIAVGGTVAVLLHLKPEMHALAAKIGDRDFKAIMRFALISLVILPVLPNQAYGPLGVWNPFKIWLMVALIVGLSLGGYVIYKFVGARAGLVANGILGGVISSTATSVIMARRSKQSPAAVGQAAFVIVAASAIVFVRVAILVGVTAPAFLQSATGPLAGIFVTMTALSWWNWRRVRNESAPKLEQENPSELKPAILFALLYGLVLLAVAAVKQYFGEGGLFAVAIFSGLTDMDAITLSIAQLVHSAQMTSDTGWRLIVVAAMSNLVFKAAIVAILGGRQLLGRIAISFGITIAVGLGLLGLL
jgi:uncharacterized membrane protein (DUF4010 family)